MSSELLTRFERLPVHDLPGGLRLVHAATFASRLRGLGGLDELPPDQALEIAGSSVHTFTMRFSLDLIWRACDGRVVRVDHGVSRGRIRLCLGARSVIETAAGRADAFLDALS